MAGNQPLAKFKHGSVEAVIFENKLQKNGTSFTVRKAVLQRNYLDINDIPKAIVVLTKAYDFLTRSDKGDDPQGRD